MAFQFCTKESETTPASTEISFTWTNPALNDTISFNESLHVDAVIMANVNLDGYAVYIWDSINDSIYYQAKYDLQTNHYIVHEHWLNQINDTVGMKVIVQIQKNDNTFQQFHRKVFCMP